MGKCVFCGVECVEHSKEVAMEVGQKLKKVNNNLLAMLYPHIFKYCPKCNMVELNVPADKIEKVKAEKTTLYKILNDPKLQAIDENMTIRQAEIRGCVADLVEDKREMYLCCKVSADLLNAYISNLLETSGTNVVNKNGESFRLLNEENMEKLKFAKTLRDNLNLAVLSRYSTLGEENTNILLMLIYIDTTIDVVDIDKNYASFINNARKMIEVIRPSLTEPYLAVLDSIETKCKEREDKLRNS